MEEMSVFFLTFTVRSKMSFAKPFLKCCPGHQQVNLRHVEASTDHRNSFVKIE